METTEIVKAFTAMWRTQDAIDRQIRESLPVIAGRLKISAPFPMWPTSQALNALKKELKNWDMGKRRWK